MGGSPHSADGLGNASTAAASNSDRPVGLVCEPCQAVGWMYAQYDDRWNTPIPLAQTRVTDINGSVIDSGGRTRGLATFGLEDGMPHQSVSHELGTHQFHAPQEGRIVCELLAEPQGLEPAELEAQIIADLQAFARDMETAIQPWVQRWEDEGWWGLVGSFFDNVGEGLSTWWEGEGEFWTTVWNWLSSLPELAADAFEGAVTGARELWDNRDKIMSLIQYLAEGLVDEFEDGLETLQEIIAAIPGLEEIAGILEAAVQDSAEWALAMIEMVRETRVLQALAGTVIGAIVMIPPNFWTDVLAVATGYLIPEVILAVLFAIIAFFTAGVGAAALTARLTAFVGKVVTKLRSIGPAGAIIIRVFGFLNDLIGKMVNLVRSLRSRIAERANGATGEATPIIRTTRSRLSQSQIDEILNTPKGQRPDPSTYMSQADIDEHLARFDDGAVRITSADAIDSYGTAGPPGGFVMPKSEFDDMIQSTGGDMSLIENRLGLDPGSLSSGEMVAVKIDPVDFNGLRIPSGNELGANSQWLPGGFTSGGAPEAVMDFDGVPFEVMKIGGS